MTTTKKKWEKDKIRNLVSAVYYAHTEPHSAEGVIESTTNFLDALHKANLQEINLDDYKSLPLKKVKKKRGRLKEIADRQLKNKCTCVLRKEGTIIGLCLRCTIREVNAHSEGYDHAFEDLIKYIDGEAPTPRFGDWKKIIIKKLHLLKKKMEGGE